MSHTERRPSIPTARTDITDEWMSQALGADVAIVEEQRVGTGQVGMCVRYRLEGSDDAPGRVVAKLPSDDDASRATGVAMRNYEREVRFYNEIAPTVGIRTPRCYHADWSAESGLFVLLLEDLAPAVQGDQIDGCTVDQAALALDELAKLHAPRWADPALADIAWLRDRDAEGVAALVSLYRTLWPGFLEIYSGVMTPSQIALGERFGESIESWVAGDHAPRTVIHGDYRLDNMLFGTDEGGYPLSVVDWQTPGAAPRSAMPRTSWARGCCRMNAVRTRSIFSVGITSSSRPAGCATSRGTTAGRTTGGGRSPAASCPSSPR